MYLCKSSIQQATKIIFVECRRHAGHSKWQNIRHVKGEKDAERANMCAHFARRMKVAVAEGKSAKPSVNLKLAQVIEEAKKKFIPIATINGVLEKLEGGKSKAQPELIDFRGPGNSLFIMRLLTDNIKGMRMNLNSIFRKTSCIASEGKTAKAFDHIGFVMTEIKCELDSAINDAIDVGAEDVEEITEDGARAFKFICDPAYLPRITQQLSKLNYNVITSDEEFIPRSTVKLNDEDLKKIDSLYKRLEPIDEIVTITHNIEIPEGENK